MGYGFQENACLFPSSIVYNYLCYDQAPILMIELEGSYKLPVSTEDKTELIIITVLDNITPKSRIESSHFLQQN